MAQRFNIEEVQHITSNDIQMRQKRSPNIQYPMMSFATAKFITKTATKRSAIARDTMKELLLFLRLRSVTTATHTRMLPAVLKTMKNDRTQPIRTCSISE